MALTRAFKLLPLVFLSLAACRSETLTDDGTTTTLPPAATAGYLTVRLATPRGDDGAVQFAVHGPAIDSVTLLNYDGFVSNDGLSANFVVTGNVANGEVAHVFVPDLSKASNYTVSVAAAAARTSYQLQALDGYSATVAK
ncbi:MAG TPA: hypothetical protein VGM77_06380 [Gemmatimonadales bacterium]|jgi:hypothetical protein